ncbi:MAG: SH3 domain-containing protein [Clostridia bacterium]|nr:SH3 domain-containing protein [Clostridia bacterium]
MKRRILTALLCVILVAATLIAPVSASAASSRKKIEILQVTVDGARVRSGPSSAYEVLTSVKKGSKVFYLDKQKNSFCRVRTAYGTVGYMYRGFLKSYGAAYKDQIYYCKSRNIKVYKKASTGSKRVTTLSKGQHVIVYQTKGSWAYIKTLGGKGGYVKKSALKKAS